MIEHYRVREYLRARAEYRRPRRTRMEQIDTLDGLLDEYGNGVTVEATGNEGGQWNVAISAQVETKGRFRTGAHGSTFDEAASNAVKALRTQIASHPGA